MTTAWVCEQTSTNHNELPDLTATSGAVAGAAGATAAQGAAALAGTDGPVKSLGTELSKQKEKEAEGNKILQVGAGLVAAGALVFAGYMFAWPIISGWLEAEPESVAFVDPDAAPTQRFVIDGDTLYLEGTVPDEGISNSMQAMAADALGEDRVVNNLEVDSSAVYRDDAQVPLSVAETVLFSTGRADVGTQYQDLINLGVDLMSTQDAVTLTVVGHTDNVGDDALNLELSIQRAQATADEFVRRGIAAERVSVQGRGETEPIATNDTEEGRSTNRRVEFLIRGLG